MKKIENILISRINNLIPRSGEREKEKGKVSEAIVKFSNKRISWVFIHYIQILILELKFPFPLISKQIL